MHELELHRNKTKNTYVYSYFREQHQLDQEKKIHNPNLYAIWNLKVYIVWKIAEKNHFQSDFFIYSDMGAWRQGVITHWPNQLIVKSVVNKIYNKILFGQVYEMNPLSYSELNAYIEGGFFGGTKEAINMFQFIYYNLHDYRLKNGLFVGKDQVIMNILAFESSNVSIARLNAYDVKCLDNNYQNRWFLYQIYFSELKPLCYSEKARDLSLII